MDLTRVIDTMHEAGETVDRLRAEVDKGYQVLSVNGVPQERAKNIANGIQVLLTRCDRELDTLRAENERLRKEHSQMGRERDAAMTNRLGFDEWNSERLEAIHKATVAEAALATAHELLREWRTTELDPADEEYQEWMNQFVERVDRALKDKQP